MCDILCATDEPVEENTVDRPEAEPPNPTQGVSSQGVTTKQQQKKQKLRGKVIRSVRFTTQEQTKLRHVNPNASLCATPGHFHGESRKRRRAKECSQENAGEDLVLNFATHTCLAAPTHVCDTLCVQQMSQWKKTQLIFPKTMMVLK